MWRERRGWAVGRAGGADENEEKLRPGAMIVHPIQES
jgi:hypothetical protein